jgi:hypothetical protein
MSKTVFKFMGAEFKILRDQETLNGNLGLCKYGPRELLIARGLLPRERATTLIHEMAHATFDRLGLWKKQDEMMVQRVECILESIITENPDLIREIVDNLVGPQIIKEKGKKRGR